MRIWKPPFYLHILTQTFASLSISYTILLESGKAGIWPHWVSEPVPLTISYIASVCCGYRHGAQTATASMDLPVTVLWGQNRLINKLKKSYRNHMSKITGSEQKLKASKKFWFFKASITLIPKPYKERTQNEIGLTYLWIANNNINRLLATRILLHVKRLIYRDKIEFPLRNARMVQF